MNVYVYEYDIEILGVLGGNKTEHRTESFINFTDFTTDVTSNKDKWYISNEKTYAGTINEIDINRVLNPLGL